MKVIRLITHLLCFFLAFTQPGTCSTTDSLQTYYEKIRWDGFFSATFRSADAEIEAGRGMMFVASGRLTLQNKKGARKARHEFFAELGYIRMEKSEWEKQKDVFTYASLWSKSGPALVHSFTLSLKTQITDTWISQRNGSEPKWKSGPMLPSTLLTGYGLKVSFWKKSYLNFSFATLKLTSTPRQEQVRIEDYGIRTGRVLVRSEFGFSAQLLIEKRLHKKLEWENRTNFFGSGVRTGELTAECRNVLIYGLSRSVILRLETRAGYDGSQPLRLLVSNGLLIGYHFGKKKF